MLDILIFNLYITDKIKTWTARGAQKQKQNKGKKTMIMLESATDIKIIKRKVGYAVNFNDSTYGSCMRYFRYKKNAEAFAAGKRLDFTPTQGAGVEITEDAHYPGQDMEWTEPRTGSVQFDYEYIGYHFGAKKKNFLDKETCFYTEYPESFINMNDDYAGCYIVTVPAGTTIDFYGNEEFRVDLSDAGIKIFKAKK